MRPKARRVDVGAPGDQQPHDARTALTGRHPQRRVSEVIRDFHVDAVLTQEHLDGCLVAQPAGRDQRRLDALLVVFAELVEIDAVAGEAMVEDEPEGGQTSPVEGQRQRRGAAHRLVDGDRVEV